MWTFHFYRTGEEAGIEGYCNANFNNPESQDPGEKTWGRMKIPLCSLSDGGASLDRGLKDRKIVKTPT